MDPILIEKVVEFIPNESLEHNERIKITFSTETKAKRFLHAMCLQEDRYHQPINVNELYILLGFSPLYGYDKIGWNDLSALNLHIFKRNENSYSIEFPELEEIGNET